MPAVLVDVDGPVLTITLNRPEVHNAIDLAVCQGVADALTRLEDDPALRVGVITGSGRTFCAGADLRAADDGNALAINEFEPGGFAGFVLRGRTKPVVCAAQGTALAGGLEILLACELSVIADDAKVGLPEVKVGIMAAAGGVIALGRDLPFAQAMKLLLTAEPVDAAEAHRLGLVTEVVPRERVLARAQELARSIAGNAPCAVRATLQLARMARAGTSHPALLEANDALIRQLLDGPDAAEGRRSFLEKRPPSWSQG